VELPFEAQVASLFGLTVAELRQLPPHLAGERFEQFVCSVLLRRFHLDMLGLDELKYVVAGASDDNSTDLLAILIDGVVVQDAQHAQSLLEASDDPRVAYVFAQITTANTFLRTKMNALVSGIDNFFADRSFFPENAALEGRRAVKTAIRTFLGEDLAGRESATVYYVAMGNWVQEQELRDGPDSPLGWRKYAEHAVRRCGNLQSATTIEVVDKRRLSELLKELDRVEEPAPAPSYSRTIRVPDLLPMPTVAGLEAGYIGFISALQLIELLERPDGQGLLDLVSFHNVRGFQGMDNSVNTEIAATLAGDRPEEFLLRNNGVTLVAERATYAAGDLSLENYQLVNGWQTSSVLYHQRQHLGPDASVFVPLKVVVTQSDVLRDAIVRSTNRQTAVADVQQSAQTPFVRRLWAAFEERRRTGDPEALWLERRDGEFRGDPTVVAARVVSLRELMGAMTAVVFRQPHVAAKGPAAMQANERLLFNDQHDVAPYFLSARVLYVVWRWMEAQPSRDWDRFEPHLCFGLALLLEPTTLPKDPAHQMVLDGSRLMLTRLDQPENVARAMERAGEVVRDIVSAYPRGSAEWRDAARVKRLLTLPLGKRLAKLKAQLKWAP
jgi:AIPR protein